MRLEQLTKYREKWLINQGDISIGKSCVLLPGDSCTGEVNVKPSHSQGSHIHDPQKIFLVACGSQSASLQAYVFGATKAYWTFSLSFSMMSSGGLSARELDSLLQRLWHIEAIKGQSQFKGLDTIPHQLRITNLIHIPILELKVCKSLSLWYHVGDIWFKFNRFALLDDVISNIFKKFIVLLFFSGVMELLALILFWIFLNSL